MKRTPRGAFSARLGAGLALLALPAILGAGRLHTLHTELKSSDPARDTVLADPPVAIKLTYTTDVQLALSSVEVRSSGPGDAAAGKLGYPADDRHDVLILPLNQPLANGTYTVSWATAGPDSHPISGTFDFTVAAPEQVAAGGARPPPAGNEAAELQAQGDGSGTRAGFDRSQALYRIMLYAGIVAVLGATVFRLLVLGPCARAGESREVIGSASRNATTVVAGGLGFLLVTIPARLWDQAEAFFPDDVAGNLLTVATGTPWAVSWWLLVVGVLLAGSGLFVRSRNGVRPFGWKVIATGALLLALVPVLSGHGWSDSPRALSAAATWLHVVAAGGWMGGLACVLLAGLPALRRHGAESPADAPGIAGMVDAFSRVAQVAVALLLVTGALKVWIHIGAVTDLWTTRWGRTLLIKDLLVAGVLALGFYNWRVVRPALAGDPHPRRLQRPAVFELLIGVAVVGVTAFLVGQPLD
ncbi:MAG: hypothetical protein F4087_05770 [Gemmatimonadetes bacterium]|nr:hypothetical protein [Gemmatimonadota bacterium]MYE70332.1 hypothetical protein [Gemmatimonadota bacterium]MYJ68005.1 hypothetical protein [Gemmatimonadota bacterium]